MYGKRAFCLKAEGPFKFGSYVEMLSAHQFL